MNPLKRKEDDSMENQDIDYDQLIKQRIREALMSDSMGYDQKSSVPKPTKDKGNSGLLLLLPFLFFGLMINRIRKKRKT